MFTEHLIREFYNEMYVSIRNSAMHMMQGTTCTI